MRLKLRHILLWAPVITITVVTGLYHWAGMQTLFMIKMTGLVMYLSLLSWLILALRMIRIARIERVFYEDKSFVIQVKSVIILVFGNKVIPHLGSVLAELSGNNNFPDAYRFEELSYFVIGIAVYYLVTRLVGFRLSKWTMPFLYKIYCKLTKIKLPIINRIYRLFINKNKRT